MIAAAIEKRPNPLDVINQLGRLQGRLHGKIKAPGQKEIIQGAIQASQGAGIKAVSGKGEINIRTGPVAAQGPRSIEGCLLDGRESGQDTSNLRHGCGRQTVADWRCLRSGLRVCLSSHGRRSQSCKRVSSSWKAAM